MRVTLIDLLARRSRHTERRINTTHARQQGFDYYGGVIVGAQAIGSLAQSPAVWDEVLRLLANLQTDDYVTYVRDFVEYGQRTAGSSWSYADILTALEGATRLIRPASYLEIGVRRGRSMAVVAHGAQDCSIVGIDVWQPEYAGMENPGPDHVRSELQKVGFAGNLELITGDSHRLLPQLFATRPELTFDLITVDGDHSARGAARDLRDVLPRLRVGGALVFDDIVHPAHSYLRGVWQRTVAAKPRYSTWYFDEIGYGVAVAVRRW